DRQIGWLDRPREDPSGRCIECNVPLDPVGMKVRWQSMGWATLDAGGASGPRVGASRCAPHGRNEISFSGTSSLPIAVVAISAGRTGSRSEAICPELLATPHRRNPASPGPSMLRSSTGLAMCWPRRAVACAVAAGALGWTNQARRLDRPLDTETV